MREDLGLLLQLQQWDLETMRLESELNSWAPQRAELVAKVLQGREQAEELKQKWMRVEVERKELESQIGQLQEQLAKYATQQLQTRKNDEYRAFQTQIDTTGKKISDLETRVLEKMELEDQARKQYKKTLAANEVIERRAGNELNSDDLKQVALRKLKSEKLSERNLLTWWNPGCGHVMNGCSQTNEDMFWWE